MIWRVFVTALCFGIVIGSAWLTRSSERTYPVPERMEQHCADMIGVDDYGAPIDQDGGPVSYRCLIEE